MIINERIVANVKQNGLTKQQVQLLKKSFRQIDAKRVATKFYYSLFELHPEIKGLFSMDNNELMDKLMSVLELVVFSFEEKSDNNFRLQDSLIIPLRDLGRKHSHKGIMPEHYVLGNNLLLQAIEDEVGFSFDEETKNSWRMALDYLSEVMQDTEAEMKSFVPVYDSFSLREKLRQIISTLKKASFFQ